MFCGGRTELSARFDKCGGVTQVKRVASLTALLLLSSAVQAGAWGASGHRIIGLCAARALPAETPAFLRTADAIWDLGELAREADRSKGAGQPHDADLDPGHYVNVGDDGRIAGGPELAALPRTRADYDAALRAQGSDSGKVGWLPYAVVDGWQQLVKDFAYYRIDQMGVTHGADAAQRAWFVKDLKLRQGLILRDLGYWSHFVGDASQPLHVTTHFNAWGDYPNPHNYTSERIHGPFEGEFIHQFVSDSEVCAAMAPLRAMDGSIMAETADYIGATRAQVEPLFALWTAGAFKAAKPDQARGFAVARLAVGAAELRDLVVAAWRASPDATVGYPAVKVSAIESGAAPIPIDAIQGND